MTTALMTIIPLTATLAKTGGTGMGFWVMIIAMFAIMYFFMIRPQQKKQKEIEKFRKALHLGQDVITAGGIHGIIRQINDEDNTITVEIAKDIKVKIDKASIFADAASMPQKAK